MSSLTNNLAGTAYDHTASLGYNAAGQLDTPSKSNDAYAWAGHYNIDRVSSASGLSQLKPAAPCGGETSVPTLNYDTRGNLITSGSRAALGLNN